MPATRPIFQEDFMRPKPGRKRLIYSTHFPLDRALQRLDGTSPVEMQHAIELIWQPG